MRKMIGTLLAAFMLMGLVCFPATSAGAKNIKVVLGDQDFLLVNSTGVEINALYVTPHNAKKWGEDILGADTLPDGEDLLITFPNKTKSKYWDLRIEDADGAYIEWDNLNLMKISRVELFFKNGRATADLQ